MKYRTYHGQNLLQHCIEVSLLAGHMAADVGGREETARRAGLLHEIGRVHDGSSGHTILASAELAGKYGESEEVVQTIQSLHPDVAPKTLDAILLRTADRLSTNRPGARKENLEIFIERLRRLEAIAARFPGVDQAYAVKAGKEIRVVVDTKKVNDEEAHKLSKEIARALEQDLSFPGSIKVSVIRETRSVQFAI
jgi:ribonuclease Y